MLAPDEQPSPSIHKKTHWRLKAASGTPQSCVGQYIDSPNFGILEQAQFIS